MSRWPAAGLTNARRASRLRGVNARRAALGLCIALLLAIGDRSLAQAAPPAGPAPGEVVVEGGEQVVRPQPEPRAPLPTDPYRPGARTVLTRKDFGGTQETVADALEAVPGLTVTRSGDGLGATHVSIRGSPADQVLVLLDGVPVSAPGDHPAQRSAQGRSGVDLAEIPLSQVQSIEVVRGAATSLYGPGAAAGAILIRTRRPPGGSLDASAEAGSDGYRAGHVTWSVPLGGKAQTDALTLSAGVRRSDGSYVYADPAAASGTTTTPAVNPCAQPLGGNLFRRGCNATRSASVAADWRSGAHRHVFARLETLRRDGLGGTQDPQPFGIERRHRVRLLYEDAQRLSKPRAGAANTADPPEPIVLAWRADAERLALTRDANRTAPQASLQAAYTDTRGGGEVRAHRWLGLQRLTAGTASRREVLHDRNFRAGRSTGAVFAAWDYHPAGGTWRASLRRDAPSDFEGRTTARLALSQTLAGGFGVKASHASGYRPPTLFERYDPGEYGDTSVANPDLQPESTLSSDGGAFWSAGDAFYGEVLAFRQDARQQIVALPAPASPNLFRFENVGRTRTHGLEASLSIRPGEGLALDASWTRQRATILDNAAVDPRDNGHQVPGVPGQHWNLALNWRHGGWHAWLQAHHSGVRYVDTANSRYLAAYSVADAGVTAPLGRGWSLSLTGRNLGNVTYAELDNYPPPGRQLFLTLRWSRGPPPSPAPGLSPAAGISPPGTSPPSQPAGSQSP